MFSISLHRVTRATIQPHDSKIAFPVLGGFALVPLVLAQDQPPKPDCMGVLNTGSRRG
jgi:hypothetical protein